MRSLRKQIENLQFEIDGDIHHGECFYEQEMLDSLLDNLNKMKHLAVALYKENQEEV